MTNVLCQRCRRETEGQVIVPPPIEDLDLRSLPYVDMSEHMHVPACGGVYFAVADRGMCYIGQSGDMATRWRHHRMIERLLLEKEGRLLWIEISDPALRREYEKKAIERFRPLWNRGGDEHFGGHMPTFVRKERVRRFVSEHSSHAFNRELHPNFAH